MDTPRPRLDTDTLKHLRGVVQAINKSPRRSVPMAEVVSLPAQLPAGLAITVDFQASRELGHEMIVLRVPVASSPAMPHPKLADLSSRELEIGALVASGLTNKQIAEQLFISLSTVKTHVHNVLKKANFPNRTAIAAAYHFSGNKSASATSSLPDKGNLLPLNRCRNRSLD